MLRLRCCPLQAAVSFTWALTEVAFNADSLSRWITSSGGSCWLPAMLAAETVTCDALMCRLFFLPGNTCTKCVPHGTSCLRCRRQMSRKVVWIRLSRPSPTWGANRSLSDRIIVWGDFLLLWLQKNNRVADDNINSATVCHLWRKPAHRSVIRSDLKSCSWQHI